MDAKFDLNEPIDCSYCLNRTFCTPDEDGYPECAECKEDLLGNCSNCGNVLTRDEVEFCDAPACQEAAKVYDSP